MLFADIRGSTQLAENISPSQFGQIINRFYTVSTDKLIMADALIDKLIGDEVTAFFIPGLAGERHARRAVEAAAEILTATGHADPDGPWVPVGIGIHTGVAYVGVVGDVDNVSDITVLGDVANTASRLAGEARAGEIIISDAVVNNADIDTSGLEKKTLTLKGKSQPLDSWALQINAQHPRAI
jgi:adenylate cyclase